MNGELSEGQFERYLRTDRLEARRVAEELSSHTLINEEGEVGTLPLDLPGAVA